MEEIWEFTAVSMSSIPRKITSYDMLEKLGRVRLSEHFFMREMLYSSISDYHANTSELNILPNYPEDPHLAVQAGTMLCQSLLEPLRAKFGHVVIRSAYRSPKVNEFGNKRDLNCSSNENSAADHIWDLRDKEGNMGACVTIQLPWFMDQNLTSNQWTSLAWWIHDNLPYHSQFYFNSNGTLNLGWRENPERWIRSYIEPRGYLTREGMDNWSGGHSEHYSWIDEKLK